MFWELAVALSLVASQAEAAPAFIQTAIALAAAVDCETPALDATATLTLENRLAAELDGFADLEGVRRRIRDRVCNAVRKGAPLRAVPFEQYGRRALTDYSYSVGFLMFTDLEQLMGRTALDAGLRDYFQGHKAIGGSIEDLRRALERASKTDLSGPWGRWMTGVDWVAAVCSAAP